MLRCTVLEANSYIYVYGMLSNGESELMLKARYDDNQSNESIYYLRGYTVHAVDDWYYKMGELPEKWYDGDVLGWDQGHLGSFPVSTNHIQLYKF